MRNLTRYIRFAALAAVVLLAAVTPCHAGADKGLASSDLARIKKSTQSFVKAVLAKDWAALAQIYGQDASLNPPNAPAVNGRAAIQAWFEAFPPLTAFSLSEAQVDGRGDLAYVLGAYSMTLDIPDAPSPVVDSGKYIEIRRRQPDGKWLISVDIFNSDLPAGH